MICSDVYGNVGGDWVDCLSGQETANGNFSLNPRFCDTLGGAFAVRETSPCAPANNSCGVLIGSEPVGCSYVCGNANGEGNVDIVDAVYLIVYIFAGGDPPVPLAAGDADCSGGVDISDAVYLIKYIFAGGPKPCAACK